MIINVFEDFRPEGDGRPGPKGFCYQKEKLCNFCRLNFESISHCAFFAGLEKVCPPLIVCNSKNVVILPNCVAKCCFFVRCRGSFENFILVIWSILFNFQISIFFFLPF